MTLRTQLTVDGLVLSEPDRRRIEHRLRALERRLAHHPDPAATLVLRPYPGGQGVEANLRVQLGPHGTHVVSHRAAPAPAHAVRLAAEDVERQLERRHAAQRGEPTFGVPSRRLPARLRPHPPGAGAGGTAG
jgi:ribosome-associated translation inhibitor RaiA